MSLWVRENDIFLFSAHVIENSCSQECGHSLVWEFSANNMGRISGAVSKLTRAFGQLCIWQEYSFIIIFMYATCSFWNKKISLHFILIWCGKHFALLYFKSVLLTLEKSTHTHTHTHTSICEFLNMLLFYMVIFKIKNQWWKILSMKVHRKH